MFRAFQLSSNCQLAIMKCSCCPWIVANSETSFNIYFTSFHLPVQYPV